MKIIIGNDHAGVELKQNLVKYLQEKGNEVINVGTDTQESVDYPDIAEAVGKLVLENKDSLGIIVCGTGIGISIAANKLKTKNQREEMYDKYTDISIYLSYKI